MHFIFAGRVYTFETCNSLFNAQNDNLLIPGVRVIACIGLAQKSGAEAAFGTRGIALESAALAFPRFPAEGATVITSWFR